MPRFSLVLATIDRVEEPDRFLASMASQSFKDFRVIVVDQNRDDRLRPVLRRHEKSMDIERVRMSGNGLSRARNAGLRASTGEIVGFPDDDCWYASDVLERLHRSFEENPTWGALSGRAINENGLPLTGKRQSEQCLVTRMSVWRLCIEFTMFLRREYCEQIGFFDETLGPNAGTPWGAGEDTDYLLRAMQFEALVAFDPTVEIFHPDWTQTYDRQTRAKARRYAMGMGRVLKVHGFPIWFVAYYLARPLAGASISAMALNFEKARYHFANFSGRARGWAAKS